MWAGSIDYVKDSSVFKMAWPSELSAAINYADFAEELWLHEICRPLSKKFPISTWYDVRHQDFFLRFNFFCHFLVLSLPLLHHYTSLQLVILLFAIPLPLPPLPLPHWLPLSLYIISTSSSSLSSSPFTPFSFIFFDFHVLLFPYFSLISPSYLYFFFLISTSIPSTIASSNPASSTSFSSSFL